VGTHALVRTAALLLVGRGLLAQTAPAPEPTAPIVSVNGHVQLDMIGDFDRIDPAWTGALRPTRIPVVCPGDAGCGPAGETTLSVRASRLNVVGAIPTSLGVLRTRIEFDLFGTATDAGRTTFRFRHAWGELGSVGAGQTNSLFMDGDAFPAGIEYWGPAGIIAIRTAQLRWTPIRRRGATLAVSMESPTSSIDVGRAFGADDTLGLRRRTLTPDFHVQWRLVRDWGHVQLSGVLTETGFESSTSANGEPTVRRTGGGVSASTRVRLVPRGTLVAQATTGRGIAGYLNDGGVDLAPAGDPPLRPRLVPTRAFSVYWEQRLAPAFLLSIGGSENRQYPSALQEEDALRVGRYGTVDLHWTPDPALLFGISLQRATRRTNELGEAGATRLQLSARWSFDSRPSR
jgi:hypothetical protein